MCAARHILILCGIAEIDGHAFCSGLEKVRQDLGDTAILLDQVYTYSVTDLIRGAIFRPRLDTSRSERFLLGMGSLGELIDKYNQHEAPKCHDRIYALLGMMSTELPRTDFVPDYRIPWS
jgi:hypothetical protein